MRSDEVDQGQDGEEGRSGEGRKGRGESGSAGVVAREVQLTDGLLKYMQSIGASMKQITDILKNWAHLKGENLARALAEFSRDVTRASAHAEVKIETNGGFTLLFDLIRILSGRDSVGHTPKLGQAPTR